MKVTKGTIARTAILVLTMINSGLAIFGKSPLPISDETVTQVVSFGFSTAAALVAWWKNNSFTQPAITADGIKDLLKDGYELVDAVDELKKD